VFPGWVVDMLPVFLVTGAYELFLYSDGPFPERRLKAVQVLSRTGLRMIEGQEKDLTQALEHDSTDDLIECYTLKTGALWSTAGQAVAIICGADATDEKKITECGMNMALYYQFLDDVGDATGTVAEIGKTAGLDKNKLTAVNMYGLEGAKKHAKVFQERALSFLDEYGIKANFLRHLINRASYVLD
jgi:geranylgeranyl diphosphate synthase type II